MEDLEQSDLDQDRNASVQSPIDPVDVDGINAANAGTAISALAVILLWWQRSLLDERGFGWWFWVAIAATGSGLLFSAYTRYRKHRRQTQAAHQSSVEQ